MVSLQTRFTDPEYRVGTYGSLIFVNWARTPPASAIRKLMRQLESLSTNQDTIYLGAVPTLSHVPTEEEQRLTVEIARWLSKNTKESHYVLEGNSLMATTARALFRGMRTASQTGRQVFGYSIPDISNTYIHADLPTVAQKISSHLGLSTLTLLEAIEEFRR